MSSKFRLVVVLTLKTWINNLWSRWLPSLDTVGATHQFFSTVFFFSIYDVILFITYFWWLIKAPRYFISSTSTCSQARRLLARRPSLLLTFAGFGHLLSRSLLGLQQLLDPLWLTRHVGQENQRRAAKNLSGIRGKRAKWRSAERRIWSSSSLLHGQLTWRHCCGLLTWSRHERRELMSCLKLSDGRESGWSRNTKIKDTQTVYILFLISPNNRKQQTTWQQWRRRRSVVPWWIERLMAIPVPNDYEESNTKDQFW